MRKEIQLQITYVIELRNFITSNYITSDYITAHPWSPPGSDVRFPSGVRNAPRPLNNFPSFLQAAYSAE